MPSSLNFIRNKQIYKHLNEILQQAPTIPLTDKTKIVIFSDLHMGDGSFKDDFIQNSELFNYILGNYYHRKNYTLVLNGDIEELQRFPAQKIYKYWESSFNLFRQFHKEGKLYKTVGNHDMLLYSMEGAEKLFPLYDGIKIQYKEKNLLVFHGHQASFNFTRYNSIVGFLLKYILNPLGIKNYSVSHNSRKQFRIERDVYNFSAFKKIVSIIGHTHRPLFESLSKVERLRFKIEQLCRDYTETEDEKEENLIKKSIKRYKKDLISEYRENKGNSLRTDIYNSIFHLPCLFNSGCVIGKRGITCLEISKGNIRLVHWFDKNISKKYLKIEGYNPKGIEDTDYFRMVINREKLDYIFTRIKFLS